MRLAGTGVSGSGRSSVTEWVVAFLVVLLPADYQQIRLGVETREGLIPGMEVRETQAHWKGQDKDIFLFLYEPFPDRDGGPMAIRQSYPVTVLGQQTKLIETSMFFGSEQQVFVTHVSLEEPKAVLMIYSPNLEREEFTAFITSLKRRPTVEAPETLY